MPTSTSLPVLESFSDHIMYFCTCGNNNVNKIKGPSDFDGYEVWFSPELAQLGLKSRYNNHSDMIDHWLIT